MKYKYFLCSSLTSMTIPSSVKTIGELAFGECSSLTSVIVEATTPPIINGSLFIDAPLSVIYVPQESVQAYKNTNGWSSYSSIIKAIE